MNTCRVRHAVCFGNQTFRLTTLVTFISLFSVYRWQIVLALQRCVHKECVALYISQYKIEPQQVENERFILNSLTNRTFAP